MNKIFLLIIIYISFISLGLPDGLLGTAWPAMRTTFNMPLEAAGIFIMITTLCTAISSFISGYIISRLGTGRLAFISCVMTGLALLGYSQAPSYFWFLILTVPLGFGAGAVDTALNNYVAKHFSSRHMSWLHSCWGVGASIGPVIMSYAIMSSNNWRFGYSIVATVQLLLSVVLLLSLSLWKMNDSEQRNFSQNESFSKNVLHNKGVWLSIIAFPVYIGIESGAGVWLGSLLVEGRGIPQTTAALWISLFYGSITIGRFLTGFLTTKFTNRQLIRNGLIMAIIGAVVLTLSIKVLILPAIILLGLGCAPVYPCMIHETPRRFGGQQSEVITGYQVGASYLAGVVIIPIIGLLAGRIALETISLSILLFSVLTLVITEALNS